jgi:hypothetical protein
MESRPPLKGELSSVHVWPDIVATFVARTRRTSRSRRQIPTRIPDAGQERLCRRV